MSLVAGKLGFVVKPEKLEEPLYELTHARHDPAHCLAPGLFRSLRKGDRKRLKLYVVYECGGTRLEFYGPEPLGADDLRVLQGLIAMAGPRGQTLSPNPRTPGGKQLRQSLHLQWEAVQANALVVDGSYRELAAQIGYINVDDSRPIRDCIERLWKVSIVVQHQGKRQGYRLLSEFASDDADEAQGRGRLHVALNPRIASAVMGESPYSRIDLSEVRRLRSDPALLIHQRLCGFIDPGKTRSVGLNTLASYAWPDEAVGSALRMRHKRAREALAEIEGCGWTVIESAKGRFEISRPKCIPCFQ